MASNPYAQAYGKNKWGDTVWRNPYLQDIPGDVGGEQNPAAAARNAFAGFGHASTSTNPWVNYFTENIAPGTNLLWQAFGGPSQAGTAQDSLEGMNNFIQRMANASTGQWGSTPGMNNVAGMAPGGTPAASAGAGGWLNLGGMHDLLRRLQTGEGGNTALESSLKSFAVDDPKGEKSAQAIQNLLGAAGAMSMNALSRRAMGTELAQQLQDYQQRQAAGITSGDKGFLDYLRGTGWLNRWIR